MTLDIRGSLKNSKISSNQYIVFEELISNAIDSFLIRKHVDGSVADLKVEVAVEFVRADLLEDLESIVISCKDNGCGLGDDQVQAFVTKDTSYKDDLPIDGIGKCKGAGRIQFFHHFSALFVESYFKRGKEIVRRVMRFAEPKKQINADDFQSNVVDDGQLGTFIKLENFKESARARMSHGEQLSSLFSARALKKQMLVAFLQRLVSLEGRLGNFEIKFTARHWKRDVEVEVLARPDLPKITSDKVVMVEEQDPKTGQGLGSYQSFKISHYQLDRSIFDLAKNAIAFCAKSSPVKDITSRYLRTRTEQNRPVGGFSHIVLIESDYLDRHVNEQRDDFEGIPQVVPNEDFFSSERLSYGGIYQAIDPVVESMVVPADWRKDAVVKEVADRFGVNEAMLHDTSTRIVYGETAQAVAERVLKKYQERVIDETAEIFSLKEEIIKSEPDSDEFRSKINELSWKYTSSLKNFDMANLSQLVVRRAAIVEILELACSRSLTIQKAPRGGKRKDEAIIHSIFFPMKADTQTVSDHDIWLLSEDYQYYDYIASDVPLASIAWNERETIFSSDIDEAFQALLNKRVVDNRGKRPDIAIFSKEGSVIIVEFKAPGVSVDEHIGDLSEYAHLLAAKSGGKLKKIYGYLIGDTVNSLRLSGSWTPFPTGNGWFQSGPLMDPYTRQPLGETYFEILHFGDVIERARRRIRVYQSRLKLDLQRAGR